MNQTPKAFQILKEDLNVKMHTHLCKEWLRHHPNCVGCPSFRDCKEWNSRTAQLAQMRRKAREEYSSGVTIVFF